MIRNIIALLLLLIIVGGCEYEEGAEEVTVNDQFSITVPHFLSETNRLSPNTPFQYQSKYRSLYVICKPDDKTVFNSLENYTDTLLSGFKKQITDAKITPLPKKELNGYPAMFNEITGWIDGKQIYYRLVTIEGQEQYYQLCLWTLVEKKEQHLDTFEEIVNSFKILNRLTSKYSPIFKRNY